MFVRPVIVIRGVELDPFALSAGQVTSPYEAWIKARPISASAGSSRGGVTQLVPESSSPMGTR
jgi:hypothetical protein